MRRPFNVLVPDFQFRDGAPLERETAGKTFRWRFYRESRADRIPDAHWRSADALLCWHEMPIDRGIVKRLDKCRAIVRCGVGFDHIDLKATGAAGIPVCNVPDYGTSEVADHAIALLLAFTRGIVASHNHLKADPVKGWSYALAPTTRRMRGARFGIVGMGRIGTATALRAKTFGYEVWGYDPYVPRGQEIALGITRVERLHDLLSAVDVVSIHTPLTEATLGLIGAAAFRAMRRDAILINTARGAIVDTDALADALKAGRIAAAGIDVLPEEPPKSGGKLVRAFAEDLPWQRGRLILTPHSAWSSAASQMDARRKAVETALAYLVKRDLRNCVNLHYLNGSARGLANGVVVPSRHH
jgi:D-3-phosphoglycerate dehydrogenase